ncbi:MAG: hypothetical protein NDI63_08420 [Pseudobdellovibrio sp.]|nr:hypothetical protein [Pseudobdellovibrio sp.]
MKKIISLVMIVLFSVISTQAMAEDAFPAGRVAATGPERNGDGQDVVTENQSGVTVLGAGSSQVKTCMGCQTSGNVILSSAARRAGPGVKQTVGAGATTGGSSSSDPVGTGN